MRLVVKQNGETVNEFQFAKGPIYIGRQEKNQVHLANSAVSRQHAVLFNTQDGKWTVEDLDSANKTYLNDQAIHKVEIKTGDCIRIVDFTIEINLEEGAEPQTETEVETETKVETDSVVETESAAETEAGAESQQEDAETEELNQSEDTITDASAISSTQFIERRLNTADAPPIRIPAQRATDLLQANEKINKVSNADELLLTLLDTTSKQLGTYQNWCALRNKPTGPMTYHAGRTRKGKPVDLSEIKLNEKINDAIDKKRFFLYIFSRDMSKEARGQIRSVIIAPIMGPAGCFGVLYANNTFRDDHYSLSDLDYLMLLGMHAATAMLKL